MMKSRQVWLESMFRIADPVLEALSNKRLKEMMPVESPSAGRETYAYLEALGRLLAGIAPWLEQKHDGEEEKLRSKYALMARKSIDAATDPISPDFMNFTEGGQPLVDAAFLSHAVVRAPHELYEQLEPRVKKQLIHCLKQTRRIKAVPSNWLLFSAMVEAALYVMGEEDYDVMRVDYALKQHEQWYVGDGTYGDGPNFHWDYYNSFVIQPMLVDVHLTFRGLHADWDSAYESVMIRAVRYGTVLERMISPEGTFPPLGRSLAYRFGAFQMLSQLVLMGTLSPDLSFASVRCALTAVLQRTMAAEGTFDDNGWLQIGFCGKQPDIAEGYVCTGSLYLCSTLFLPLGLPSNHFFWTSPDEPWTQQKAWGGQSFSLDHSVF
ncbi:DUF2264 domain-containing protein [Paenibacillus sp. Marseille-Q4541]|uniref:DUF2264 domain-containing protein n=1 Tax=Paenibacillus sp. Marseille-Q4541 TaxID=2831522 RepID=UPI001BADBB0B|nr:DUF2264 domain-containing protein [Paenibacillus sp. Marseille-Q4541]